jgi:hypothetical protein
MRFWRRPLSTWSVFPIAIAIASLLIGGVLLASTLTAGYGWSERDWNRDGHTSFGEFFRAGDIGTRSVTQNSVVCVEYFSLKDGSSVRIDCPTPSGSPR